MERMQWYMSGFLYLSMYGTKTKHTCNSICLNSDDLGLFHEDIQNIFGTVWLLYVN